MQLRLLISAFALFTAVVAGARAEAAKPAPKAGHEETELEQTMGKMSRLWRSIRKASRDGKLGPHNATAVANLRTAAESALKMTPALEAEKPAEDQAKFQRDYEARMQKFISTLTTLEKALRNSDTAQANKLIGELNDLMKEGHHDFKKPDEHDRR